LVDEDDPNACSGLCVEGACTECNPAMAATCSMNGLRSCTASGTWTTTPCPDDAPHCADGACGPPPSCLDLADTCGPVPANGSTGTEHCCASPVVAGGDYYQNGNPALEAGVSNFRLDRFEVTVGRFRQFKTAWDAGWRPEAGAGKHSHLHGGLGLADASPSGGFESGWTAAWASLVVLTDEALSGGPNEARATWSSAIASKESLPINFVNAYEARAFCIWDEGFLPSGAEWSYAASGGNEQRPYPWGDEVPDDNTLLAKYACGQYGNCPNNAIATVGLIPAGASKYGQLDLAGNIAERTQGGPATATFCEDCVEGSGTPGMIIDRVRGGAFDSPLEGIGSAYSEEIDALERRAQVGFRCARPP
jgi:sulfatase modifying factor 1